MALNKLHQSKVIFTSLRPDLILIDEKGYPRLHCLNYCKYTDEYHKGVCEE